MKKLFLLGAIVCVLGMMTACKSGTASDIATTAEITWTTIEDKLANEIPLDENDCLFILTDTTLDDGHSEEEFLGDFPMYRACKGAEENFKSILNNM